MMNVLFFKESTKSLPKPASGYALLSLYQFDSIRTQCQILRELHIQSAAKAHPLKRSLEGVENGLGHVLLSRRQVVINLFALLPFHEPQKSVVRVLSPGREP